MQILFTISKCTYAALLDNTALLRYVGLNLVGSTYTMPRHSTLDKVKEALKNRGMRQAHLAKKLNISRQQLSNIFSGKQTSSVYLPKIAQILDIDVSTLKHGITQPIKFVQVLVDQDLKSLVDHSVRFEELTHVVLDSVPFAIFQVHYCFGYILKESYERYHQGDLLVFSTFLPLASQCNGRYGIVYIKSKNIVCTGFLIYNIDDKILSLYDGQKLFNLKPGDLLFGVDIILQRQLRKME